MSDLNNKQTKGFQPSSNSNSNGIDLGSIPDAWTMEDEAVVASVKPPLSDEIKVTEMTPKSVSGDEPDASDEVVTKSAEIVGENDPAINPAAEDDLSGIAAASEEDIASTQKRNREADLDQGSEDYTKSASQGEKELKRRMFELEQMLHTVDWDDHDRLYFWGSPFISKVVELMSDHLGISKGRVYEAAIIMFYKNCFSEGAKLADMGLMLDSATLQNQELAIEISALEDLANLAMQAEASPLNQSAPKIGA